MGATHGLGPCTGSTCLRLYGVPSRSGGLPARGANQNGVRLAARIARTRHGSPLARSAGVALPAGAAPPAAAGSSSCRNGRLRSLMRWITT
jgi:hypothetical protein